MVLSAICHIHGWKVFGPHIENKDDVVISWLLRTEDSSNYFLLPAGWYQELPSDRLLNNTKIPSRQTQELTASAFSHGRPSRKHALVCLFEQQHKAAPCSHLVNMLWTEGKSGRQGKGCEGVPCSSGPNPSPFLSVNQHLASDKTSSRRHFLSQRSSHYLACRGLCSR